MKDQLTVIQDAYAAAESTVETLKAAGVTLEQQLLREAQIVGGSICLDAAELAPRLGFSTSRKGIESLCRQAAARTVPGRKIGNKWMFHWPTVVEKLFQPPKSPLNLPWQHFG